MWPPRAVFPQLSLGSFTAFGCTSVGVPSQALQHDPCKVTKGNLRRMLEGMAKIRQQSTAKDQEYQIDEQVNILSEHCLVLEVGCCFWGNRSPACTSARTWRR